MKQKHEVSTTELTHKTKATLEMVLDGWMAYAVIRIPKIERFLHGDIGWLSNIRIKNEERRNLQNLAVNTCFFVLVQT